MGPTERRFHLHDGDISVGLYRLAVLGATLAFTAILLMWTLTTPPFRGMHEHENFNAIIRLEYGGGWPTEDAQISQGVFLAMQESGLYTALPRTTADWSTLDFADVTPPASPSVIDATNALVPAETYVADTAYVNPPLYYWVQAKAADAAGMEGTDWRTQLQFARLLNVLMAMWIPALIATAAKHIATKRWAAATVAFLPLGIPELAHTVTTVAPDALYVTGCLALTAAVTLVMHHGPTLRRSALVGVLLGLTSLVSLFAVFMVPLIIAGFVLARPASKWLMDVVHTGFALLVAIVTGGGWWIVASLSGKALIRSERANTFLPEFTLTSPDASQGLLEYVGSQFTQSAVSFWGSFGYFEVELNPTLAVMLSAVLALGIARMYVVGHVESGFPTWLPSGALGIGLFGLLTAFQGFYRPFDESLGEAVGRWEAWTPGGLAVLIPAIVFLMLVVAVPMVVNVKILRPENWEVASGESGIDQRQRSQSSPAQRVDALVGARLP